MFYFFLFNIKNNQHVQNHLEGPIQEGSFFEWEKFLIKIWLCFHVICPTSCHSPASPEYQAHSCSSCVWFHLVLKKTREKSHKTHLKLKHLFHHFFVSNSQYLSECLFSAACSKWQQLISLFCELETYLLQKTWYEKRASYRPHLIPSERLLCVPLFSLLYSLSCFPLFFHFFSLCLNWSLTRILMSWICEVHLDVQNDFLPSFFFSHRTASSYCAWRPLRESRSNYQSRGA